MAKGSNAIVLRQKVAHSIHLVFQIIQKALRMRDFILTNMYVLVFCTYIICTYFLATAFLLFFFVSGKRLFPFNTLFD